MCAKNIGSVDSVKLFTAPGANGPMLVGVAVGYGNPINLAFDKTALETTPSSNLGAHDQENSIYLSLFEFDSSSPHPHGTNTKYQLSKGGLGTTGRFLVNFVRPLDGTLASASDRERAEYAMLLMKIGSVEEAKAILSIIKSDEVPEVEMYQAFCKMALWNYDEAIISLKKYLAYSTNEYQRLVAI